jgi:pyridoxamine 5'-phosphate oxidase family protein
MYRLDDDADVIDTTGRQLTTTKKWRDVLHNGRAAVVVDDVRPPFRPRGIEIRGRAEAIEGPEPVIRIYPRRIVAWGLDDTPAMRNARDVQPR